MSKKKRGEERMKEEDNIFESEDEDFRKDRHKELRLQGLF